MDRIMELMMTYLLMPFVVVAMPVCIAALLGMGGYGLYRWMNPPETFVLRVDAWACTKSHEQDRQICTKGCYWVRETVCDQWTAN